MQVKASLQTAHVAPRKIAEVAALIRSRTVADALVILSHTPRRSATTMIKVLNSAKANALNNFNLVEDTLVIKSVEINNAGSLKRFRAAARGSAAPFRRGLSHISISLEGEAKVKKEPVTVKAVKKENHGPKS